MSLATLLSAEQIIPEMKAVERWSAIVELIDLLVQLGKIKAEDRESILASLKQREETMSTGIGFGIAIPHASSDRIEEVVAAFGRSSQGIEFDALDNAPVKFVVLFIVPKNQFQTHLRTLASIAKFLNDRSVRESLGSAQSADEILAIFRDRSQSKREWKLSRRFLRGSWLTRLRRPGYRPKRWLRRQPTRDLAITKSTWR